VGAGNPVTLCGLRILAEQSAKPIPLAENEPELPFAGYQHPVQAFAAGTGDPPFAGRVARIVNYT
jgi:hypothetical protein